MSELDRLTDDEIQELRAEVKRLRVLAMLVAEADWLDITACHKCGEPVLTTPDGMIAWCSRCRPMEEE